MNIVITGASRGIGLELCKQAMGHTVLAVARRPQDSPTLLGLKVITIAVELTDESAAEKIAAAVKDWSCVDLLINNAGVFKGYATSEEFLAAFHVNSVVPFMVTRALLPQLKKSSVPKAVHITSKMGSIGDNGTGGSYSYRASKAALNMICKSMAIDNPWLTTALIHPGWVQTDMGGKGAPVKTVDSAKGIWNVIHSLKPSDTGGFFDYLGENLPW